jgi:subtilisin family serine protease
MKRNFTALFFTFLGYVALAQQSQLSANLQQYLAQSKTFAKTVVKSKKDGTVYISTLIKVSPQVDEQSLLKLGCLIGTKAGNIWTVRVPELQIKPFTHISGIAYIQLDESITAQLDVARKSSRVDSVTEGIQLPKAYTGKNVVVGIIDAGFDYSHPTFYDTTGKVLRIKRVWEQDATGTPPQGYSYGNELKDTASMLAKGTDVASFSHGAHVGGIAAGSGIGSLNNKKNRGIAFESELVFVGIRPAKTEWTGMGMASIIDGLNYIYSYAEQVGKPAVVNLSWGCSIGPNDGSSLFSQACNNLTGPGRLFVVSAGNNGDENLHLEKTFSAVDTVVQTFISLPDIDGEKRTWIDVWGQVGQSFCVELSLNNGATKLSSIPICLTNNTLDTFLVGALNDTCYLTITALVADYNQKPHVLIDVFSKTQSVVGLTIKASQGNVHAWLGYVKDYRGHYGAFITNGQAGAIAGNSAYTLGELSCTQTAITVAAYASKISFRNLQGSLQSYSGYAINNQIVPFSSHGPTVDGRIKPNIAAPGMTLASAVNSYDVSYAPGGGNYANSVTQYVSPKNGRTYYYGEASGTSMSAPMVSGIVALLLQVNPSLTPQLAQDIIRVTAIKDNATTQTPDSSRWGAGKVNAYAAIKRAILTLDIKEVEKPITAMSLYPNPTSRNCSVSIESSLPKAVWLEVMDVCGRVQYDMPLSLEEGFNEFDLNTESLSPGMYLVRISGGKGSVWLQRLVVQ